MSFAHLPEDQARRAEQLYESLKAATDHDLKTIAELLATRPDDQLQTAAEQRKKGGTKAPA
jgi:hypothetical protein